MLEDSIEASPTCNTIAPRQSLLLRRQLRRQHSSSETKDTNLFNRTFPLINELEEEIPSVHRNCGHQSLREQIQQRNTTQDNKAAGEFIDGPIDNVANLSQDDDWQLSHHKESTFIRNFPLFEAEKQLVLADYRQNDRIPSSQTFPESKGFTTCERLLEAIPEMKVSSKKLIENARVLHSNEILNVNNEIIHSINGKENHNPRLECTTPIAANEIDNIVLSAFVDNENEFLPSIPDDIRHFRPATDNRTIDFKDNKTISKDEKHLTSTKDNKMIAKTSVVESIFKDFLDEDDSDASPSVSPRWLNRSPLYMLLQKPLRIYPMQQKRCGTTTKDPVFQAIPEKCQDAWQADVNPADDETDDDVIDIQIDTTESNTPNNDADPFHDISLNCSLSTGTQHLHENLLNISSYFVDRTTTSHHHDEEQRDSYYSLVISDRNDEFLATPDYESLPCSSGTVPASQQSYNVVSESGDLWSEDCLSELIREILTLNQRHRCMCEDEQSFSSSDDFLGFCVRADSVGSISSPSASPAELQFETQVTNDSQIDLLDTLQPTEDPQLQELYQQLESGELPTKYLEGLTAIENLEDLSEVKEKFVENEINDTTDDVLFLTSLEEDQTTIMPKNESQPEEDTIHSEELKLFDEIGVDNWESERDLFLKQPAKAEVETSIEIKGEIGFQTAAGKTINVSKAAQKLVENLLKDIDTEMETESDKCGQELFTLKSEIHKKNIKTKAKLPNPCQTNVVEPYLPRRETEKPNENVGFQTANGRNIAISEKAVKSVEHILREFQTNDVASMDDNGDVESKDNDITRELQSIKMKIREKQQKDQKRMESSTSMVKETHPISNSSQPSSSNIESNMKSNCATPADLPKAVEENTAFVTEYSNFLLSEWPLSPIAGRNPIQESLQDMKYSSPAFNNSQVKPPNLCSKNDDNRTLSQDLNKSAVEEISLPVNDTEEEQISSHQGNRNQRQISPPLDENQEKIFSPPHLSGELEKENSETTISNSVVINPEVSLISNLQKSEEISSTSPLNRSNKSISKLILRTRNKFSPKATLKLRQKGNSTLSSLDRIANRAIIKRKNLLSLNKKRKERDETKSETRPRTLEVEFNENCLSRVEDCKTDPSFQIRRIEDNERIVSNLSPSTPKPEYLLARKADELSTSTPQSVHRITEASTKIIPKYFSPIEFEGSLNIASINDSISEMERSLCSKANQERIDRLSSYGEAPAITPLRLNTSNKCRLSGLRRTRRIVSKPS